MGVNLYFLFIGVSLFVLCGLIVYWVKEKIREARVTDRHAEREQYMDTYRRLRVRNETKTRARLEAVACNSAGGDIEPFEIPEIDILEEKFGVDVPTEFKPRKRA